MLCDCVTRGCGAHSPAAAAAAAVHQSVVDRAVSSSRAALACAAGSVGGRSSLGPRFIGADGQGQMSGKCRSRVWIGSLSLAEAGC